MKEKCTEKYHSMVVDECAKFAPSPHSNLSDKGNWANACGGGITALALVANAFMDCTQAQDCPCSAETIPRYWSNKQIMDKVQTEGLENISVHSAWHHWSFLAVDNYGLFPE